MMCINIYIYYHIFAHILYHIVYNNHTNTKMWSSHPYLDVNDFGPETCVFSYAFRPVSAPSQFLALSAEIPM